MKANVRPSYKAQIEAAAALLKDSTGGHGVITAAGTAVLVTGNSPMGDRMLAEHRILFSAADRGRPLSRLHREAPVAGHFVNRPLGKSARPARQSFEHRESVCAPFAGCVLLCDSF